jgi:hypothetical protein
MAFASLGQERRWSGVQRFGRSIGSLRPPVGAPFLRQGRPPAALQQADTTACLDSGDAEA